MTLWLTDGWPVALVWVFFFAGAMARGAAIYWVGRGLRGAGDRRRRSRSTAMATSQTNNATATMGTNPIRRPKTSPNTSPSAPRARRKRFMMRTIRQPSAAVGNRLLT